MSDMKTDDPDKIDPLLLYRSEEGYEKIMSWYDSVVAKIEAPVQSHYVDTRYGRTHMLAAGPADAEPLLLIPGAAGSAPLFRRAIPYLSKNFRVYALDVVGGPGRSAPNPLSYSDSSYVHWLCDVLDGLHLHSAHIAGQSAGGGLAMKFGVEQPDRARSVIMFGPTGLSRARLPVKIWVTKVMTKRSANALEEDLTAKSIRPERTGGSFGTYDRELARSMALCTKHFRLDRSLGIFDEDRQRINVMKGLGVLKKFFLAEPKSWQASLKVPALLIFGEHELSLNPYKICAKAEKVIPGIETAVIKHAGHGAIFDQPEKVAQMMERFVARQSPKNTEPHADVSKFLLRASCDV